MLAIETEGLTKDYPIGFWRQRPHRVLDRLSLQVESGEVFGFIGPNGAGKTTTLKLLMQLVFPTAGHARLLGRPAGDREAKRRLGYLPESPYFYDHLTAEELLLYFGALLGLSRADRRRRTASLLDEVGIGAERRLPLRRFSKGMLQRVGIAQALLNQPELVILDEPMSGLDPVGRREFRDQRGGQRADCRGHPGGDRAVRARSARLRVVFVRRRGRRARRHGGTRTADSKNHHSARGFGAVGIGIFVERHAA